MRVLIACEESQTVCKAFRARGHEAYSCDVVPCSGGHPEWHIQDDVLKHLVGWDMILAFPPCTHLAVSGAPHFAKKRADGRQQQGIEFFMTFTTLTCLKVAIENPVGIMSSIYQKPTQIIQPYQFGHPQMKTTCLWLKGLPKLLPTQLVEREYVVLKNGKRYPKWSYDTFILPKADRARERSKTFEGIANAMAEQWG